LPRTTTILCLALLSAACGSKAPDTPTPGVRVIRSMQLNEGKPSHISFESPYAKGTIEIAGDVHIGYQSVTVTPENAGASRQVITLDGKVLEFDGPELKIGGQSCGKLEGEVDIELSAAGVVFRGGVR
jgi:hypothetical protein